jgi:hypothetical protein
MAPESDSVRIARIEEGLIRLHERISSHHQAVMTALKPAVERSENNMIEIVRIKRDYRWTFLIATFFVPTLLTGVEIYLHYFRTSGS